MITEHARLTEAAKHAQDVADSYADQDCDCATEHSELASWLREVVELRTQSVNKQAELNIKTVELEVEREELARVREEMDTLCDLRDRVAMMVPIGQESGTPEDSVERYIKSLIGDRKAANVEVKRCEMKCEPTKGNLGKPRPEGRGGCQQLTEMFRSAEFQLQACEETREELDRSFKEVVAENVKLQAELVKEKLELPSWANGTFDSVGKLSKLFSEDARFKEFGVTGDEATEIAFDTLILLHKELKKAKAEIERRKRTQPMHEGRVVSQGAFNGFMANYNEATKLNERLQAELTDAKGRAIVAEMHLKDAESRGGKITIVQRPVKP